MALIVLFIFLTAEFLFIAISNIENKVKRLHHYENDNRYLDQLNTGLYNDRESAF